MGNSNSQENQQYNKQRGAGYLDNNAELQRNIEKLIKASKTYTATDTIGFVRESESDIDFESMRELQQNGGSLDFLNVKPRRQRFNNVPVNSTKPIQTIKSLKTDANTNDLAFLKSLPATQKGGCGCNAGANDPVSDTSSDAINYDVMKGGKRKNLVGGNDNESEEETDDSSSSSTEEENNSTSNTTDATKTTDDEPDGETVEEEEDEDDDDEDDDSGSDDVESGSESAYSDSKTSSNNYLVISSQEGGKKSNKKEKKSKKTKSSKSKSKSSKLSKSKKLSRNHLNEHIGHDSSENDIVIDYKHLYSSEGDNFHESDESNDQFGEYRNRNMFRFK